MDKQVLADGPLAAIIPDGVRVGDVIHLSGAISIDGEMNPMHEGDFLAQNRRTYELIGKALEGLGAGPENVVKETVFVTDVSMAAGSPDAPWQAYAEMRDEFYGGKGAEVAQSLVQVGALVLPEALVEIEVVAHL